jgi:hypothetical protein
VSRTAHARRPRAERIELCREIVGRRVELTRDVAARGGHLFPAGTRMTVEQTWRGRFRLCIGFASPFFISDVGRWSFRLLAVEPIGLPCRQCSHTYGTAGGFAPAEAGPCAVCGRGAAA